MKIVIIGYSGAGKTTLASALERNLETKVFHADAAVVDEYGRPRKAQEAMAMAEAFMADAQGGWIIDGYYEQCVKDAWMEESDRIVFLDMGKSTCFWRVVKRYAKGYTKYVLNALKPVRRAKWEGAMADREKPEPFTSRVSRNLRDIIKHFRAIIQAEHNPKVETYYRGIGGPYSEKFVILKTRREVRQFLEAMRKGEKG